VGTFIPKPHTPYQWSPQLDADSAAKKLAYIRDRLKPRGFKVGVHDPLVSAVEGIFSRGDERAGEMALAAFTRGARLDAWTDFFKRDLWLDLIRENPGISGWAARDMDAELPWDFIDTGTGKGFLKREWRRSENHELTSPCMENCTNPCGICGPDRKVVYNSIHDEKLLHVPQAEQPYVERADAEPAVSVRPERDPEMWRMLFSFSKSGRALFLSHLSLVEVFSMAFVRSGLPIQYSRGFNPLPRLDIASPLSIGIGALAEIASAELDKPVTPELFIAALNAAFPEGIQITKAELFCVPGGHKKYSVSALLWGFEYDGKQIKKSDEKSYRAGRGYGLVREKVLADRTIPFAAKNNGKDNTGGQEGTDYFELYRTLYGNPGKPKLP
jgi:hypothetical protein